MVEVMLPPLPFRCLYIDYLLSFFAGRSLHAAGLNSIVDYMFMKEAFSFMAFIATTKLEGTSCLFEYYTSK